jgi:hypothetical protein
VAKAKKEEKKKEPKVYIKKDHTARNQCRQAKIQGRKQLRLDMMEQCCKKLQLKRPDLQRLVGTLNIHRLQDILDDIYLDSKWYKLRRVVRENKSKTEKQMASMAPQAANDRPSQGNEQTDPAENSKSGDQQDR